MGGQERSSGGGPGGFAYRPCPSDLSRGNPGQQAGAVVAGLSFPEESPSVPN